VFYKLRERRGERREGGKTTRGQCRAYCTMSEHTQRIRGQQQQQQEHCLRVSDKASRSDWPKIARETKLEEEAQIPSSSIHHPSAFVL